MNAQLIKQGLANMERLRRRVALAEETSPALKKRGERFRKRLDERQERNLALIMSEPDSKAYRDYIETPARFGVPEPKGFTKAPRLAEIMAEKKCSRNAAKTYQAMCQVKADEAFYKRTGRHFLTVTSAPKTTRRRKAAKA